MTRTEVDFNSDFFDNIMRSAGVRKLSDEAASRALAAAQASAPIDTGAYREGLHIEHESSGFRESARVVGSDPKTMLIEAKTGNLARALKSVKKSG